MKIALAHNYYLHPGGEDRVFQDEVALLSENGHEVFTYVDDNKSALGMPAWKVALRTIWSRESFLRFTGFLETCRPEIVHFHNTFQQISPSVFRACSRNHVPVVQTLHNFRMICPAATLFRGGHVCEDCIGKFVPWPGVWHACYRHSRPATATVAAMLVLQKIMGQWSKSANIYIALTEFSRAKLIEGGVEAAKLMVKPNFLDYKGDPGAGAGGYALFVGRLTTDKGVDVLLRAWHEGDLPWKLKIVGDGPLRSQVEASIEAGSAIEYLGRVRQSEILELMSPAEVLLVPSLWYEGFPRVIVEAFSVGLPVVASNLGSLSTIVKHDENGLHFPANDPLALRDSIHRLASNPVRLRSMRAKARKAYEAKFTKEVNYARLMEIYQVAIERRDSSSL